MTKIEQLVNSQYQSDYAMFSDYGNAAVQAIVDAAKEKNLSWSSVCQALEKLSEIEGFGEATDTAVREVVYDRLGFYQKDQSFY